MNVYDNANDLAKAIKDSHEYKKLLSAKKDLSGDADAGKMVKDFLGKQAELQLEAMSGKQPDQAKTEQLQKLYELLSMNSKAREYIQCYMRFQMMMEDISKTISEAVKDVVGGLGDEN